MVVIFYYACGMFKKYCKKLFCHLYRVELHCPDRYVWYVGGMNGVCVNKIEKYVNIDERKRAHRSRP